MKNWKSGGLSLDAAIYLTILIFLDSVFPKNRMKGLKINTLHVSTFSLCQSQAMDGGQKRRPGVRQNCSRVLLGEEEKGEQIHTDSVSKAQTAAP